MCALDEEEDFFLSFLYSIQLSHLVPFSAFMMMFAIAAQLLIRSSLTLKLFHFLIDLAEEKGLRLVGVCGKPHLDEARKRVE